VKSRFVNDFTVIALSPLALLEMKPELQIFRSISPMNKNGETLSKLRTFCISRHLLYGPARQFT